MPGRQKQSRGGFRSVKVEEPSFETIVPEPIQNTLICLKNEPVEMSNSESSESSSSGEESDDDFELQIHKQVDSSSDSDDDLIVEISELSRDLDKKTKKRRITALKRKRVEEENKEDKDVLCDFESKAVQKQRQKKMFRRKMIRTPGNLKRRKIKRGETVIEDFKYDSFLSMGHHHVSSLTTEVDPNDTEVDHKMLARVCKELGVEDGGSDGDIEEEEEEAVADEADLIAENLSFYKSRNIKERVDQAMNLQVKPMAEKLAGYKSFKSDHGSRRPAVRSYHPDIFSDPKLHKIPEPIIWNRDFKYLVYQKFQYDPDKNTTDFLENVSEDKKTAIKNLIRSEFHQKVHEKRCSLLNQSHVFPQNSNMCFEDDVQNVVNEQLYLDVM